MSTFTTYTGDGATTQFDITFSYDDAETVYVTVDGIDTSYEFISPSRVELTPAPPSGSEVILFRRTDVSTPAVDFNDGAIVLADDLDLAVGQARNRVQEMDSEFTTLNSRSLKLPIGETASPLPLAVDRAGKYIGFNLDGDIVTVDGTDTTLAPDLFSTEDGKGAALVRFSNGQTVADLLAASDRTIYVDANTGDDSSGNGTQANPYKTIQKAVDSSAYLTGLFSVTIEVAAGTYDTSSRTLAEMARPSVVYIDGLKTGKRTSQSGSTLSGGLVLSLDPAAKITPNATYPNGIYVTGHVGSVGVSGGEVEATAGAANLIVAHRGAYLHLRDIIADGAGIAGIGLGSEAGGYMEAIDVIATGSNDDAVCYLGSIMQLSSPGGVGEVGDITNSGHVDLAVGMSVTGTIVNRARLTFTGTAANPVLFSGNYDGAGGSVYGAYVHFTNASSSIVGVAESWVVDELHSNAVLNFRGGNISLDAFQSFVAPATQSTYQQPVRALDGAHVTYSGTMNNKNSSGLIVGPDLAPNAVNVGADGTDIPISLNGQNPQVIRLNNTKGSLATGCTLSLDMSGWQAGTRIPNGQMITLVNLGGNGVQLVNGSTIAGMNAANFIVGASPAQYRAVSFVYLSAYNKWMPINSEQMVTMAAPAVTYVSPSGGATIDAEARTALDQLKADLDAVKAVLQGARLHL